ncbi:ABC transporter substrate-binding protein [Acidovorax sp. Leaf160]|uniref:ABC transporter substrate-binding protein n=1 Tax=Acidovorax sp. Leaf160 TaxID=1736280 RepID=UPI0009E7394B|nr:ABC transporter substrate-binding protein [Acidovorax sp. Leaf160]
MTPMPPPHARRQLLRSLGALVLFPAVTGMAPARAALPDAAVQAMRGTMVTRGDNAIVTFFPPASGPQRALLSIDCATETALFAPAIRDFQRRVPGLAVRCADRQSLDIHAQALARAEGRLRGAAPPLAAGEGAPDLLVSSSLDLQTQLANDGHVLAHPSSLAQSLPAGAHWRHEVFSLGADAVVMVYHPRLLAPDRAPRTRGQLLALLRDPGRPLAGRIGTYDATRSGLGYLLATQDARHDSTASVLLAAMGANRVRLGDHIEPMLDALERGELALVYNVPASYAQARIAAGSPLRLAVPEDYTLLTTRSAVIPATAPNPQLARPFLDYLISPEGQAVLARDTRLIPIRKAVAAGTAGRTSGIDPELLGAGPSSWRLLAPGLGLLVYLDPLKRQRFLQAWATSMGTG